MESIRVPFLDLRKSNKSEKFFFIESFEEILDHGQIVMGPEINLFEEKISQYCGRKFAVGVGSGTDALFLSLKALDIGPGDEVITTSLSWIATANAIALTGAKPVFADIKNDLNIDPKSVEKLINKATKAILAVDFTGRVCDMDELISLANSNSIYVVEDGSQAFGATYKRKKCGSFGTISAISHNPMKVFAALGEAGSILCDSEEIYNRLLSLRYNGTINRQVCVEPSLNGRIDTLQAAILLKKLTSQSFEDVIAKRRSNADFFDKNLVDCVQTPERTNDREDIFYTYTIKSENRDNVKSFLELKGIETQIQHPILMSQQPAYKELSSLRLTNAERLVNEILCLPINETLTFDQLEYIVSSIKSFFELKS